MAKTKGRPIAVIREELMGSPEAKEIAEKFGMPLEEYVEKVLEFVKDPDRKPQVQVVDEEEARAAGAQVSTVADIKRWIERVISGEIKLGSVREVKDGFEAPPKRKAPAKKTGAKSKT
jgi:hypothetical protein